METEIVMAIALLLEQVGTTFNIVAEPVKVTMAECIEVAKVINADLSHNLLAVCSPFVEKAITQ